MGAKELLLPVYVHCWTAEPSQLFSCSWLVFEASRHRPRGPMTRDLSDSKDQPFCVSSLLLHATA